MMEHLNRQSPIPLYQQLAGLIRNRILSGEYRPGDRLPSELQLVSQLRISRDCVRRAIDLLVKGGLVKRVHGKGNFIFEWQETSNRSESIAFLVPDTRIFLFMNMLNGVVAAATARGYTTTFSFLGANDAEEQQNFTKLQNSGVAGLVIFPRSNSNYDPCIWNLFETGFPFILVDRYYPYLPCPFVGIDNLEAAYEAVTYLIRRGFHSIGFATSADMNTTTIRDRFSGYQKALADHHIPYQPGWLYQSTIRSSSPISIETEEEREIDEYARQLKSDQRPHAIFAVNDNIAYLVSRAAKAAGLHIPTDLALMGFDDDAYARRSEVPLTTVAQPFEEIGARAAHLLIDRLRGAGGSMERALLPTRLVIRQSCGEALVRQPG